MNTADFVHIKKELRKRKITREKIAFDTFSSISLVSMALSGNYPYYAAKDSGHARLPRDIQRWLKKRGIISEESQ